MKNRMRTSLSSLFMAVTVLTLSADAAEYYLSPTGGSMSNPGTEVSPWPSLETVAASGRTFVVGDVLILMAGHHGSPILVNANVGYVTVRPRTGARATLKSLSFASAARFWHVRDLELSPETAPSYGRVTLVDMASACDCIVEGCYGYSVQDAGLKWK